MRREAILERHPDGSERARQSQEVASPGFAPQGGGLNRTAVEWTLPLTKEEAVSYYLDAAVDEGWAEVAVHCLEPRFQLSTTSHYRIDALKLSESDDFRMRLSLFIYVRDGEVGAAIAIVSPTGDDETRGRPDSDKAPDSECVEAQ